VHIYFCWGIRGSVGRNNRSILQDHMRGRHHISSQNFKALGMWASLLYIQHDPTPGSIPAPITSRIRALIPSPIFDPIPGFTPAPLPSQTRAKIQLVGEFEGASRETTGQCYRTTREENTHFHPKPYNRYMGHLSYTSNILPIL
jgi:hypothetical protein